MTSSTVSLTRWKLWTCWTMMNHDEPCWHWCQNLQSEYAAWCMIFQCHDQNTKPCLQQTAPQQPRDIFLSVQDGRSRVVDVARCCKYWRTETILSGGKVGSRWDQSPIWFTVPFKLLLGIGSGSPKSRIHPDPQSGQSAGFLSLIHKPLIMYSSPLDQHP